MHRISRPRRQRGFTLIELMITIVIIGILASIALPTYQNSVRKSHRGAAQAEMLDIANRQQQYLLANRSYTDTLSNLGYSVPSDVAARYTCTVSAPSTSGLPTFTISCAPTSLQSASGFSTLTLDSTGAKAPASEW
jgi:type IV pilus assembly protein PilE